MRQGLRNFAVLAPNDPYGRAVVQSLNATLGRYGSHLIETAYYDRTGSNIDSVVRRLADYDNRRKALLQERELLEGKEDELSKKALERLELYETFGRFALRSFVDCRWRRQAVAGCCTVAVL